MLIYRVNCAPFKKLTGYKISFANLIYLRKSETLHYSCKPSKKPEPRGGFGTAPAETRVIPRVQAGGG